MKNFLQDLGALCKVKRTYPSLPKKETQPVQMDNFILGMTNQKVNSK
jgi:hypothetical protein